MKGLEDTWQEAKMDFKGQTALVVGASRGFGRGVTESLVAKGMTVTAVARTREDLEDLARKTLARIIVADATDEQAIERILSEAKPNLLVVPALKTSKFGLASDKIRSIACSSVASATMILANVFRARSSRSSRVRATAVTVIPFATRLSVTPRPNPRLAPTTRAVCPLKSIFASCQVSSSPFIC